MQLRAAHAEYALFFVAFVWGANPPVMKWGLQYIDPMSYNAIRMIIACLFTSGFVLLRKPARRIERKDWLPLFKLSAFGFFLFQLFFTLGVTRTTAGNTSLLLGILPVTVAIINSINGLERITRRILVSIAVTLIGVVFIILGSGREISLSGNHLSGAFFLMCAQFAYGYYTVYSRPLAAKYLSYQVNACVFAVTTVLFLLVALPSLIATDWQALESPAWISAAFSGVFPLSIGNFFWVWGASIVGSTKASLFNNMAPVFAILIGYLLLGEAFGLIQTLGAVIIYTGLHIGRKQPTQSVLNQQADRETATETIGKQ